MTNSIPRRQVLQVAATGALAGVAGCSSSGTTNPEGAATVRVRVENVASTEFYAGDASTGGGLWLTPGVYAIQEGYENPIPSGEAASVGLEALAEAGQPTGFEGEPGFIDELTDAAAVAAADTFTANETVVDPNDPNGSVPGAPPIAPGGAFEFDISVEDNQQFLIASMVVPSNDLFIAPEEWITPWPADAFPIDGEITDRLALWDAGTEPNQRPGFGADQPPSQGSPTQGADEGGVVRKLNEVDDGYDYPTVEEIIQVTLTPQ